MKCAAFYTVALAFCIGLALADWDALGYGGYSSGFGYGGGYGKAAYVPVSAFPTTGSSGGFGNGGFLALIGLLVVLFAIFGSNRTGSQDQIVLLNSTLK